MITALAVGFGTGLAILLASLAAVCLIIAIDEGRPGVGVAGVVLLVAVFAALYWVMENL